MANVDDVVIGGFRFPAERVRDIGGGQFEVMLRSPVVIGKEEIADVILEEPTMGQMEQADKHTGLSQVMHLAAACIGHDVTVMRRMKQSDAQLVCEVMNALLGKSQVEVSAIS